LFFIDKENLESEKRFKNEKDKSLAVKLNNLKCYQNLKPDPNNTIPVHLINPLKEKLIDSKRTLKRDKIEIEKAKKKIQKIEKRALNVANGLKTISEKANTLLEFNKDLWDASSKPVVNQINEYFLRTTKKLPVKVNIKNEYNYLF
jgi:hypothetical protein